MANISPLRAAAAPRLTVVPAPKKKQPRQEGNDLFSALARLSFTKKTKSGWDCWAVNATSLDYHQQCQLGKAMAHEALVAMATSDCLPLLGWIILDQIKSAKNNVDSRGVIVGFAEHICRAAVMSTAKEVCHG